MLNLVWEMLILLKVILIDENLVAAVLDQGFCSEFVLGCFDGLLRRAWEPYLRSGGQRTKL
jgi:hypothetical protein